MIDSTTPFAGPSVAIEPLLVRSNVACRMLGDVSQSTLQRWAAAGLIQSVRVANNLTVFHVSEIRRFAAELAESGTLPGSDDKPI
jgi:hypothetical protein